MSGGRTLEGVGEAPQATATSLATERSALLCAGLIWSLGILIANTLPVVFEVLRTGWGLDEGQLGRLGAAFVLGGGVATGGGPFWVRRVDPRWASSLGLVATAAGLAAVIAVRDAGLLTAGWGLIGLASGVAATPSFAALGDTANPTRNYSLALFASTLLAAVVSFVLPAWMLPSFGPRGALVALALLFAFATPCAFALASGGREAGGASLAQTPVRAVPSRLAAPVVAALAGALFTGVFMGGPYNFVGSIIAADGIDETATGLFVALGLGGSLAASVLASVLGERARPVVAIGLAIALTTATYPALLGHSALLFGAGFALHGIFSTLGYVWFLGLVRGLDPTDRIYVAYPALQSVGIAVCTDLSGAILAHAPPPAFFALAAGLNAMAWLVLLLAARIGADRYARARASAS